MDDKYQKLLLLNKIYPAPFIEKFGVSGPHWFLSSYAQKERSLCHDMMCVLLSNLAPNPNLKRLYDDHLFAKLVPSKRFKGASPEPRSDDSESSGEETEPSDEEESFQDVADDLVDEGYSYLVLEGSTNDSAIQMHFANKWGISTFKKYDIVDIPNKRFIEVKTTVNPNLYLSEPYLHIPDSPSFGLVVVDVNAETIHYVGMERMPGEEKALDWLMARNGSKRELDIEDGYCEDLTSDEILFSNGRMAGVVDAMRDFVAMGENQEVGTPPMGTYEMAEINADTLFNNLKDPLMIESDKSITFKGKLTPFFWCDPIKVEGETDLEAVDYFMLELDDKSISMSGKSTLYDAVNELTAHWKSREEGKKQFGFMDLTSADKSRMSPDTLKCLGVGQKKRVHLPGAEGVKQEEHTPLTPLKYNKWIESYYGAMSKPHIFGGQTVTTRVETPSKIPFHRVAGKWVDKTIEKVSLSNSGLTINQIQNFYSRISGSYNTSFGNKTTHSKLACIPIKTVIHNGENKEWYCSGLAFRGPHHTRNATDKMTMLVIERHNDQMPKEMYDIEKTCFFKTKAGKTFVVRQECVKKIDGIHLSFINNSLFMAINNIGDLISHHNSYNISMKSALDVTVAFGSDPLAEAYSMNRVIDGIVMGVLGNSRDEGFLAMYRKFMMAMIAMRKGEPRFTFDVEGFCAKANECIIDNPFGMLLMISLRYSLAVMGTHSN